MSVYSDVVIATITFPIAGLLADIKFSCHKTIVTSLWSTLLSLPLYQCFLVEFTLQAISGSVLALPTCVGLAGLSINYIMTCLGIYKFEFAHQLIDNLLGNVYFESSYAAIPTFAPILIVQICLYLSQH